jgi:hypothetical protein
MAMIDFLLYTNCFSPIRAVGDVHVAKCVVARDGIRSKVYKSTSDHGYIRTPKPDDVIFNFFKYPC